MGRDEFLHRHIIHRDGVVRGALAHLELENQIAGGSICGNVKFADIILLRACRNALAVQSTIAFFLRAVI